MQGKRPHSPPTRTDGGTSFPNDRHRSLREVLNALRRHRIVTEVRGYPPSTFTEVRTTLAPDRWGHDVDEATFRVTWHPIEPPEFALHYSESGVDCGWHREPNPHVEGATHYQERKNGDEYTYEAVRLDGETAPELVWEVMERLRRRLESHE